MEMVLGVPPMFGVDRQDWSPGRGYSFVAFYTRLCCASTQAMLAPSRVVMPCSRVWDGAH